MCGLRGRGFGKQALRGGAGVNRSVRSRRQFEPQAQRRRQTGGANLGGTPCLQKSSCSDWKRQHARPRKRPTARGLSRSHCRLRRRPRFPTYRQSASKENAPTRHARATGRDLSSTRRRSAGADDQLTNAVACAWFELHPNLRYIKYKVAEPDQV